MSFDAYDVNNNANEWLTLRHLTLLTRIVNVHDCGGLCAVCTSFVSVFVCATKCGVMLHNSTEVGNLFHVQHHERSPSSFTITITIITITIIIVNVHHRSSSSSLTFTIIIIVNVHHRSSSSSLTFTIIVTIVNVHHRHHR